MSSRPYIVNRTANTEPTGQQLGDEWFNPVTNLLTKQVAVSGNAVAGAQVLLNIGNNVVTTGNITCSGNAIANNFTTTGSGGVISGTGTIQAGNISAALITVTADTLAVTAAAGTIAYDGNVMYSAVQSATRGAIPSEQIVVLTGTNTLTSQTAAQAIFDGGGGTANGAVTLPVGTYQFECCFAVTGFSATSGSFGFALGGAATKTFAFYAQSGKQNSLTAPTSTAANLTYSTFNTAANTALVEANTNTNGIAVIRGTIRVTVAGTIIPQISMTQAAAAVIQINSYFKVSPLGTSTVATVGNWT